MDSAYDHNYALQQNGFFSAADLEANKLGNYSTAQTQKFEDQRNYIKSTTPKYDNKGWLISLLFGFGACVFAAVLYFVGLFDSLQDILGALFLPVMCGAAMVVALFVFVIVPRQYQSSVDAFKAMGTPLVEKPLGTIQVIEAHAEVYTSQGGINRRGHQSSRVSHILQMDSIKFNITASLREVIQSKRKYRVYAVNDQGAWILLSMEALE